MLQFILVKVNGIGSYGYFFNCASGRRRKDFYKVIRKVNFLSDFGKGFKAANISHTFLQRRI